MAADHIGIEVACAEAGRQSVVAIEVPGAEELEFFPAAQAQARLVRRKVSKTEAGARIELEFERTNGATHDDHRGVLWFRGPKGEASCLVPVPEETLR